MSTIKNPVGPRPSKVYWRRRALVLVGIIAVIAIIVLIIVRPGSSSNVGDKTPAVPATSTAPAATPDATATDPQNVDSAPAADGDTPACDAANITVTPVTDADTYAAGVNPQLSMSVTNSGAVACAINVGTAQQVYTVTSGEEQYWVSTDCQADPSDTPTMIDAGATLTSTPFAWDRTRSAADTCASTDRPQVPAGGASYHLDVSIGGFASTASKQFILG